MKTTTCPVCGHPGTACFGACSFDCLRELIDARDYDPDDEPAEDLREQADHETQIDSNDIPF